MTEGSLQGELRGRRAHSRAALASGSLWKVGLEGLRAGLGFAAAVASLLLAFVALTVGVGIAVVGLFILALLAPAWFPVLFLALYWRARVRR